MMQLESFNIIGISTTTTNKNGQSAKDLQQLWERFYAENILDKIPNKIATDIYSIYTDYETNYMGKYTTIIGCKVSSLENIPTGFVGRTFDSEQYEKFIAKGEMPNAVIEKWQEIWAKDNELNRKYTADFEVYKSNDNSEVSIYIAIN